MNYSKGDKMNCKVQFHKEALTAKSADLIPKTAKMVKANTLAHEHEKSVIGLFASVVVEEAGERYLVSPQQLIPHSAQIVRDSQNAIVGIPAVAGG